MVGYLEIACGVAAIVYLAYYYLTRTFNFWKVRGVAGPKPIPLFGTIKDVILGKTVLGVYTMELYEKYRNEPMFGIFVSRNPLLILTDLDLVKDVLIRDFRNFDDRGMVYSTKVEPLLMNLVNLEPKRWQPLRLRLSPVFSSGKLKDMFDLILDCSDNLHKSVATSAETGKAIDIRDLTARYTIDVIGTCAFGLNAKALAEEDSEFRRMGKKIFESNTKAILRFRFQQYLPVLYHLLGYFIAESELTNFFTSITTQTMEHRRKHNVHRIDFINTLMDLQDHPEKLGDMKVTQELLTAQAFVFFAAGFETSSSAISNALYELALHQDVQDKLRKEIRELYKVNGGKLDYETIKTMEYMDAVFRETLRKYPATMSLKRKSVSSYTFTGTKITIPAGLDVIIPIYAIQHDPKIFPDPEVFDPERFRNGAAAKRHPMTYLAFGDGPRNCIGARFALYMLKVALIKILRDHKVEVCEKTLVTYEWDPNTYLLRPVGDLYLKASKCADS